MEDVLAQLDEIIADYHRLGTESSTHLLTRFVTRAGAAVRRVAGRDSLYAEQFEKNSASTVLVQGQAQRVAGVVESLRADVASGYLESQRELIHGELFADFLEMAQHLLDEGYKDPAAVVAGSSLEAHLRQLCQKAGVDTDATSGGKLVPKTADRLNAELAKAGVYEKLDQKNVTAWLDLRNKAAHGHYEEYGAAQVALLIGSVRDFLTRNPA